MEIFSPLFDKIVVAKIESKMYYGAIHAYSHRVLPSDIFYLFFGLKKLLIQKNVAEYILSEIWIEMSCILKIVGGIKRWRCKIQ